LNTIRSAGPIAGVLVALLDIGKAALAVAIGRWLVGAEAGALAGCAAVIGHCFSPYLLFAARNESDGGWKKFLRRTGGKGLASGMGALLVISWPVAAISMLVFGLTFAYFKDPTWPSVLGCLAAVPAMWLITGNAGLGIAALIVAATVVLKHAPDLRESYYVEAQS
jgi:glycerol-3-phosphate acyltransferase PlsY